MSGISTRRIPGVTKKEMPGMTDENLPVRRRDQELDFHDVLPDACPHCGCLFVYAKDDPGIVWDPGRAWAEECSNHDCH